MFKSIFLFEIKQGFKKPSTYIFFIIFFLLYLFVGLGLSGVLPLATGDSNVFVNSASSVAGILVGLNESIMGLVNSVILVAIMATAIQKDYEYNTHALFYTKPIKKSAYYFGRFFGAYTVALFVFFSQILGYFIGCMAGSGNPQVGPLNMMSFIEPFLLFTVPNLFLLGIIFFSLTTYTRSNMTAYLFSIVLLVIRSITDTITSDIDNKTMAAILEPFGQEAFQRITEYWTPEEQNNYLIPMSGVLLYNRLLWVGIAIIITAVSYFKFSFSQFLVPFVLFKKKVKETLSPASSQIQNLSDLPVVSRIFTTKANWKQLFYLAGFEFKKMTKSVFFVIICALGAAMMFVISQFTGAIYGTQTYPVTYQILEAVAGIFQFFILILIVFFSGTIVWRDRDNKVDELVGTTPISNTILFFSKYLGLIYVTGILMFVIMLTGIIIQLSQGYTNVEPLHYIKELFGFRLASMIVVIGLCLSFQVFLPNKYLGFFISILPILLSSFLFGLMEWNNSLYTFNSSGPGLQYSDMNGYGHKPFVFFIYKAYWISVIIFVSLLALRFFARGKEKSLKARFRLSKYSNGRGVKLATIVSLLLSIGIGSYIYYNIKVLNKYTTATDQEKIQVEFEKKYKKYQRTLQPRIVESNVKVNIYPETRSADASGFFYLKNKHAKALDTIMVIYDNELKYTKLAPLTAYTTVADDKEFGVKIWKLTKALDPGDSIKMEFALSHAPNGFKNSGAETNVVYNGTFFNSSIFPTIGYNPEYELSENAARKKYGLNKKPRMADVRDSVARMNTYISSDADWIRFESVVSTSEDQVAIAPGYLQKEWKENDRNFYHYKMDSKILNFYSFMSARYEVKKDKWLNPADPNSPVNIEIYYQKGHEYNIDRMISGIKKSLDYYTKYFSPYQHKQVRILEFPRYATFAQSFPNTIPFSEGIGFIAKVDDKDEKSIDYPFYVTAHEVAHQWWAHQVIGGNVQGGTLMSETMSQYSALMVMEKEYGKEAMKKFLEYEMNTYLLGRATEKKKEVPLMLCENQQYIHYNKGSIIMYALKDYIGEDTLNAALKRYIKKVAFQEPPYTNSIEFVDFIREACPDSLKYIVKDMFEDITVYENYVKDLSYTPTADGKFKVKLTLGSAKFKVDSIGKQKKVDVADYMDVGIFAEKTVNGKKQPKELLLQKVKMDKPEKTFEFIVAEKPVKAGLDPLGKLIDRKPDNNTWNFGSKPPKVSTAAGNDNMMMMLGGGDDEG
ncbi:MAG TPA: M1 family aminopeptidase [Bacteroidia bacterium]